jgi:hypothetical protein
MGTIVAKHILSGSNVVILAKRILDGLSVNLEPVVLPLEPQSDYRCRTYKNDGKLKKWVFEIENFKGMEFYDVQEIPDGQGIPQEPPVYVTPERGLMDY